MGLRSDGGLFVFCICVWKKLSDCQFHTVCFIVVKVDKLSQETNQHSTQLPHLPPKQARAVAIRARRASQRGGRGLCQLLPRHVTANPAIQKKSGVQMAAYVREAGTVPSCG